MTEDNQGKIYDLIAADFAKMRDSFYLEQKYLDLFMGYLQPEAQILDVGCGSGYPIAAYLIEHGFHVTGIDGPKELLNIAKINCPSMHTICGDIRTITLAQKFDAIIEWWCLFHVPKQDHSKMISRFGSWIKPGGILEFTTGEIEYDHKSSDMLNQELSFYSLDPKLYEKYLKENGFKVILRENDQEQHLVWIAQKQ